MRTRRPLSTDSPVIALRATAAARKPAVSNPAGRALSGGPLGASDILALQRSLGNQQVMRLLATSGAGASGDARGGTIMRRGGKNKNRRGRNKSGAGGTGSTAVATIPKTSTAVAVIPPKSTALVTVPRRS